MSDLEARRITSEELVRDCLDRTARHDHTIKAFASIDPDMALRQARRRDAEDRRGPLHGVPIAVKDVIDTADMPTSYGSAIYRDRIPTRDAGCVARLREAGCVILGKTATAEFAWVTPPETCNPRNVAHTPGGSSSGSAAAVADGMAPLALGTQTGGSVIRPSAYCGIVGFKPSFGRHDFGGIKHLAPSYDTLGLHARGVDDAALLDAVLIDPAAPYQPLAETRPVSVALCRTPAWDSAEPAQQDAVLTAAELLRRGGVRVVEVDLPRSLERFAEMTNIVMLAEARESLSWEYRNHRAELGGMTLELLEQALKLTPAEIGEARQGHRAALAEGDAFLAEHGTILTASAPGEAPYGIASTGSSIFNRLWTALHTPCLTLPVGTGAKGLPLGVQLIGRVRRDRELLSTAKFVENRLRN